ncbi:hypothetical protein [Rhizobium ruizarguesonis]|uniref:hypothetical protein n=1 Tax=Rhizobium ruizarguesonis TaxID=2081791 RepID=UPI0013EE88B0|nr:hypothetical protein [Rhizobium ruizarguesonis]
MSRLADVRHSHHAGKPGILEIWGIVRIVAKILDAATADLDPAPVRTFGDSV